MQDTTTPASPPPPSLRRSAIAGVSVTLFGQLVKFGVLICSTVVLSRLLTPQDFGVYAMAAPAVAGATLMQDFGLNQSIVTSQQVERRELASLFVLNAGVAILLACVLLACSPLLAALYQNQAVIPVIAVMAAAMVCSGLAAVPLALLTRSLRYTRIVSIESVAALLGLCASVTWAILSPGPLALAATMFVGSFVTLPLVWYASGYRLTRPAHFKTILGHVKFGAGLTTFNLTNFVARNADKILIGAALGPTPLGYYDRAYRLLLFPLQQINAPTARVMVPILSQLIGDENRYRLAYFRALRLMLVASVPAVVFLAVAADPFVRFALGDQWGPVAPTFRWLAIAAIHQTLTNTLGWLFLSQRRTGEFAALGAFSAVTCVAAFAGGLPFGIEGVAAAYAVSDLLLRAPVVWWCIGRKGPVRMMDLYRVAWPYVPASAAAATVLLTIMPFLTIPVPLMLGVLLVVAYAVFVTVLCITKSGRDTVTELLRMIKGKLKKK